MFDNNAPKAVPGPVIYQEKDLAPGPVKQVWRGDVAAIKGDETNTIETKSWSDCADKSDKPLVDSGKQVVKSSQGGKK